jgi:hypothetical protein
MRGAIIDDMPVVDGMAVHRTADTVAAAPA